jgi:hypothetical protein
LGKDPEENVSISASKHKNREVWCMSGQLPQKFKAGPWYHEQVVREGDALLPLKWRSFLGYA